MILSENYLFSLSYYDILLKVYGRIWGQSDSLRDDNLHAYRTFVRYTIWPGHGLQYFVLSKPGQ